MIVSSRVLRLWRLVWGKLFGVTVVPHPGMPKGVCGMVRGRHGVIAFVDDPNASEGDTRLAAFASLSDCKALASKIREAEVSLVFAPEPHVVATEHPDLTANTRSVIPLAGLKSWAATVEAIASGSDGDGGEEPAVTVGVSDGGVLFAWRRFSTGETAVVLLEGANLHAGGVPPVFPCAAETGKVVVPGVLPCVTP